MVTGKLVAIPPVALLSLTAAISGATAAEMCIPCRISKCKYVSEISLYVQSHLNVCDYIFEIAFSIYI